MKATKHATEIQTTSTSATAHATVANDTSRNKQVSITHEVSTNATTPENCFK